MANDTKYETIIVKRYSQDYIGWNVQLFLEIEWPQSFRLDDIIFEMNAKGYALTAATKGYPLTAEADDVYYFTKTV